MKRFENVKVYNCHNCDTIFNTSSWVKYSDYSELKSEYDKIIDTLENLIGPLARKL